MLYTVKSKKKKKKSRKIKKNFHFYFFSSILDNLLCYDKNKFEMFRD